jgi:hypothetical protein
VQQSGHAQLSSVSIDLQRLEGVGGCSQDNQLLGVPAILLLHFRWLHRSAF